MHRNTGLQYDLVIINIFLKTAAATVSYFELLMNFTGEIIIM